MKKYVLFSVLFLFAGVLCAQNLINEVVATDTQGNAFSLEMYKGQPMVLVQMSTKCGYCRASVAKLNKIYDAYAGQDVVIAALLDGKDSVSARFFRSETRAKFMVVYNADFIIDKIGREKGVPAFTVIDTKGKRLFRKRGLSDTIIEDLSTVIEKALAQKAPAKKADSKEEKEELFIEMVED